MALDKTTLKQLIVDNMESEFGAPEEPGKVEKMAKALADAIIDHFTSAAVVEMAGNGADSNGDTLVTNEGSIT